MRDYRKLNRIKGCLLGGALGDAMGYPVETMDVTDIQSRYGDGGLNRILRDPASGKALVSDDTQMLLFTAEGILRNNYYELDDQTIPSIYKACMRWLQTQTRPFTHDGNAFGLLTRPEMFKKRNPGNTCLSALGSGKYGSIFRPVNSSMGCGGLVRTAPLAAINSSLPLYEVDLMSAEAAAITHGHPLGYMPSAFLNHLLHRCIYDTKRSDLVSIIHDALDAVDWIFGRSMALKEYVDKLTGRILLAVSLAESDEGELSCLEKLGTGMLADETLAIAVFSALRHKNDFASAVICAVNHQGNSASTGSLTGQICGAWLGSTSLDFSTVMDLELADLINEMAELLYEYIW